MGMLDGKVAIVTGGARGIGGASAAALCGAGAAVVIGDMLEEAGEATAASLRAAGHRAVFQRLDVRDAAGWASIVARAAQEFGRVDILVNNAGISLPRTIEDATEAELRHILDINLIAPFLGMQAVIGPMKAAGGGSIINISSNSTKKVVALTTLYSPTKAALANMTKTVAVHCAQTGSNIRANSIHPGPTETDMLLGGSRDAEIPAVRALIDSIPFGRMGKPPEIASVVVFLASEASSYMTGAELFVDGGATIV
jgi:3alpha(or 20beta)-hydroxysteroid dehydrogenase